MATDARISALPANPGVASNDVVEVLDVSNTTNQATGENTKATIAQLAAAIGGGSVPFVAAGPSHAAGLVPDPGATAHASPYLMGDDGTFHPIQGSAVSYAGGAYTFTGGTGGSTPPGGTNGQIQYNSAGAFGGVTSVPVANGGTGLTAMGTSLQVLRVNSGGTALEFGTVSGGSGSPGGSPGQVQYNSAGSFGGAADLSIGTSGELILAPIAAPTISGTGQLWNETGRNGLVTAKAGGKARLNGLIWTGRDAAAVVNTAAETSLLSGVTTDHGSLTIDPTKLAVGMVFEIHLLGIYSTAAGSPTFIIKLKLGTTVLGYSTPQGIAGTQSNNVWTTYSMPLHIYVRAAGASGKLMAKGFFQSFGTTVGWWLSPNGTASSATTFTEIAIDLSGAPMAFDLTGTWSVANLSNSWQVLDGHVELKG